MKMEFAIVAQEWNVAETVNHWDLVNDDLHEPFHRVSDSNPGAVGAGRYWLDTSSTPYVLKRRNGANDGWVTIGGTAIVVKEGEATVIAVVSAFDFGAGFDVTQAPTGEANIELDLGEVDAPDHNHDGAPTQKLAQENTHENADTDASAIAIHHTLGIGEYQAAAGNHTHSGLGKYRQFVYSVSAGVMEFVVDGDGYPVMALQDLE